MRARATRVTVTATLGGSVTLPGATTVTVQVGAPGDSASRQCEDYAEVGVGHDDDSGERAERAPGRSS